MAADPDSTPVTTGQPADEGTSVTSGQPADDTDSVRSAFRLGWAIAELRGCYRPDLIEHPLPDPGPEIFRPHHELPLANERTIVEQRAELVVAVKGLSNALGLDFGLDESARTEQLDPLLDAISTRSGDPAAWEALTSYLYDWDSEIQCRLVMRPGQAAAYQLGRGLSETYWALHPEITDPDDSRCWLFLLGPRRQVTLNRYAARLAGYLDPLVLPAISASLASWGEVASDERWRSQPETRRQLYVQGLLWRDLIRGERRPADLDPVADADLFQEVRLIRKLWSAFWPQLLLGVLGVGGLVVGVIGLVGGFGIESKSLATALAVLGVFGLTLASAYAKAKASAASVLANVQDTIERDRVGRAATLTPPR